MKKPVTRLDDCPSLLVSQINDTLTNLADPGEPCRPDAITRSRRGERITPRRVGANVRAHVGLTPRGSRLFEAPVLDQHDALASALVRAPSRGNAQAVSPGIGGGPWGSVHPHPAQGWLLDSRLAEPAGEGTSTRDHVRALRTPGVSQQPRPGPAVRMATG
jgi:hypothetical protein